MSDDRSEDRSDPGEAEAMDTEQDSPEAKQDEANAGVENGAEVTAQEGYSEEGGTVGQGTEEPGGDERKEGEGKEDGEGKENGTEIVPEHSAQKNEIQPLLTQRLKKGDKWYLVDQKWLKQWKKYTGFDSWDQHNVGKDSSNPGPVDNANLFKEGASDSVKDHLMEELDYALLPESAWDKLVCWYGMTEGTRPICRCVVEYGTYVKHLKVEVYLIDLKLCIHPHVNDVKLKPFSRSDTVEILHTKLREIFEVPQEMESRVWQRYMTNSYELLQNAEQTLSDAGIYGGQTIMLEKKSTDGQWTRTSSNSAAGSSSYGTRSSYSSNSYSSSSYGYSSYGRDPASPGLCGLSNLGNTCFMNSALQCLSNTPPLVEYFLGKGDGAEKPYKKHINRDNPLGMGGAIADTYGALLEDMWSGHNSYLAPRQFKSIIGKHAPQFSGYQQHDSHELLAFLLDGLHEDLNLVRKKPYVDMDIKTENRNDKEVAEETWHKYLLRNQSVIVRKFQGQLKSTLHCPKCEKVSRIFDPFMYLSLPLPYMKTRDITVCLVRTDPKACVTKYRLSVPKNGSVLHLKEAMQKYVPVNTANLVVIDVYHSRFHRVYYDKDPLSHIMERDDIYLYELKTPLGDQDWVPVPVYMRELKTHKSTSYLGQRHVSTYGQVFGLPIVVTAPRKGCTYRQLYDIIMTQTSRYVTRPKRSKEGEGEKEVIMKEPDADGSQVEEMEVDEADDGTSQEVESKTSEQPQTETNTQPETSEQDQTQTDTSDTSNRTETGTSGQTSTEATQDAQSENQTVDQEMTTISTKSEEPMDTEGNTEEKQEGEKQEGEKQKKEENQDKEKEDTEKENKEKEEEEKQEDLFNLVVVNSYGSQEVQKLRDDGQILKLTSQTYVGCDWELETRESYYDSNKSLSYEEHESCHATKEEKKPITVYSCVELFAQEETLGEEDAWYCPNCKEFVQATKKFDLWKMPEVLVIHLKRFSYSRFWRNKLEAKVEFPLEGLDLSEYVINEDEPPPLYDLFAVSNHYGGLGGGHYTAYAKNKDNGKWYSFDDSHVSEVSDPHQICSSASYVLFYERKTEGSRVPDKLNRSLSVSFDEEVKEGHKRFRKKQSSQSMDTDSNRIVEAEEDGEGNDNTFEGTEDN